MSGALKSQEWWGAHSWKQNKCTNNKGLELSNIKTDYIQVNFRAESIGRIHNQVSVEEFITAYIMQQTKKHVN